MEKSLDATASTTTSVELQTAQPLSIPSQPSSMPSQTPGLPPSTLSLALPSASSGEILDQALRIITDRNFLSEDELLAASLLFTSTSDDVVHIAQTLFALNNNPGVEHHFIIRQLEETGLLPGKEKGKAREDSDDVPMEC